MQRKINVDKNINDKIFLLHILILKIKKYVKINKNL